MKINFLSDETLSVIAGGLKSFGLGYSFAVVTSPGSVLGLNLGLNLGLQLAGPGSNFGCNFSRFSHDVHQSDHGGIKGRFGTAD